MYILISATIILWLAVVTIIYKLKEMNSLLLDCQRDVVDLLYKTRAIDNWIDKQAELKTLTLNPDTITKRLKDIEDNIKELNREFKYDIRYMVKFLYNEISKKKDEVEDEAI